MKVSKSIIFLVESFLGNFYRHFFLVALFASLPLFTFVHRLCLPRTLSPSIYLILSSLSLYLSLSHSFSFFLLLSHAYKYKRIVWKWRDFFIAAILPLVHGRLFISLWLYLSLCLVSLFALSLLLPTSLYSFSKMFTVCFFLSFSLSFFHTIQRLPLTFTKMKFKKFYNSKSPSVQGIHASPLLTISFSFIQVNIFIDSFFRSFVHILKSTLLSLHSHPKEYISFQIK